jgi:hypothetical protein
MKPDLVLAFVAAVSIAAVAPFPAKAQSFAQATPAQSLTSEDLFWQSVRDSDDPAMYEAYLEQVSKGTFSGTYKTLAEIKIKALRKAAPAAAEPAAPVVEPAAPEPAAVEPAAPFSPTTMAHGEANQTAPSRRCGRRSAEARPGASSSPKQPRMRAASPGVVSLKSSASPPLSTPTARSSPGE